MNAPVMQELHAYDRTAQFLWLAVMEHTGQYLLPTYIFDGYHIPDTSRRSTIMRLLMNSFFSLIEDEDAVVPVTSRAEGLANYNGFINGEVGITTRSLSV
jgi:hypothetical protein